MQVRTMLAALVLLTMLLPWRNVSAADLALVLLTDVSSSMGDDEFKHGEGGLPHRLRRSGSPRAIAENRRGVAVTYVEFSDENSVLVVKGWDLLTDSSVGPGLRQGGRRRAALQHRQHGAAATASGGRRSCCWPAISRARVWSSMWPAIIPATAGNRPPSASASSRPGITVNALPIMTNNRAGSFDGRTTFASAQWGLGGIVGFYRENVIAGPGSFLVEANDYKAFGEALKRKLLLELIAGGNLEDASVRPRTLTPPTMQSAAAE